MYFYARVINRRRIEQKLDIRLCGHTFLIIPLEADMAPRRRKDHKGRVRDGWEIDYVVDG